MAEEGAVNGCHTAEQLTQLLEQGKQSKKLVVLYFTASWCGPCRLIAPLVVELAKKFTDALFLKVDIDELNAVTRDWAIRTVPTIILLKEGTVVDKLGGADKEELPGKIEFHLSKQ